ncbi:hypothetical protein evm_012696, partial [Chilo suppressalis]
TLEYHEVGAVNARCQRICGQWDRLGALTQRRRLALDDAERVLEQIDLHHLEFAKRAAPFNNWLDGTREDLVDMFIVHTIEEISGLMDAHSRFKATLGEADKEYQAIVNLVHQVESIVKQHQIPGGLENPYTTLTAHELNRKWSDVRQLVPQRDGTLAAELRKQQNNENLRRQFAEKANAVGPWIERQMDAVTAIGMGLQGSLEDQLHRLKEYEAGVYAYKPHIEELERIHQAVQEGMIFENSLLMLLLLVNAYKPYIEELERIHQAVQEGMIFENSLLMSPLLLHAYLAHRGIGMHPLSRTRGHDLREQIRKQLQAIVNLVHQVESIVKQHQIPGGLENPYTTLTAHELNRKWSDVRQLVPQRDGTLAAELRKQQNNENLRRQFAEKANAVGPWIERQMDAVTAIGMGLQANFCTANHRRVAIHENHLAILFRQFPMAAIPLQRCKIFFFAKRFVPP